MRRPGEEASLRPTEASLSTHSPAPGLKGSASQSGQTSMVPRFPGRRGNALRGGAAGEPVSPRGPGWASRAKAETGTRMLHVGLGLAMGQLHFTRKALCWGQCGTDQPSVPGSWIPGASVKNPREEEGSTSSSKPDHLNADSGLWRPGCSHCHPPSPVSSPYLLLLEETTQTRLHGAAPPFTGTRGRVSTGFTDMRPGCPPTRGLGLPRSCWPRAPGRAALADGEPRETMPGHSALFRRDGSAHCKWGAGAWTTSKPSASL